MIAGYIPANELVNRVRQTNIRIWFFGMKVKSMLANDFIDPEKLYTIKSTINREIKDRMNDSDNNCHIISTFLAPIIFRIPISWGIGNHCRGSPGSFCRCRWKFYSYNGLFSCLYPKSSGKSGRRNDIQPFGRDRRISADRRAGCCLDRSLQYDSLIYRRSQDQVW